MSPIRIPKFAGTFFEQLLTSLIRRYFQISNDSPYLVVALPSMNISIS